LGNGVVILPPHAFDDPLRWYWQMKGIKMYDLSARTNGVMSVAKFIEIRLFILELLHGSDGHKWRCCHQDSPVEY
jgi:hypothetical protein